uniref:Guanylate cyclase n=1 Tax=Rhabditophanes sp. KR3021 TaxID=114890 RepID=A0AC35UGA1_9BILA
MFGWIHMSLLILVTRKYSRETWLKILEIAKFDEGTEAEISHYYKDEDTMRIVNAMATVIKIPVEEVWEAYGGFLIQFTMETGWDELLRAMASDLEGFLDSLDSLHYFIDHVVYRTKLKGPSFRCETLKDGTLVLHYYSKRSGLYPIVKGVVREVARRIYDTEVVMKVQERKQEHLDTYITEHVVFHITTVKNGSSSSVTKSLTSKSSNSELSLSTNRGYELTLADFMTAFPHHICFDRNLVIQHMGSNLARTIPHIRCTETILSEIVDLIHPELPLSFESLIAFKNSLFVFRIKSFLPDGENDSSAVIELKGSVVHLEDTDYMLYLCSLSVTTVRELVVNSLFLSDMQQHDGTRDLIMLNQSRMSQVELNKKLEETTKSLKRLALDLEVETQRTDELLCELMPASVAESLRQGKQIDAKEFEETTCLFTDIVTFTQICSMCSPYDVVNLLNDMYLRFDNLVTLSEIYKLETIGDAFVVVAGAPMAVPNHAERVLNCAIGMLMESRNVKNPITKKSIGIRIGINSGSCVAGVVGVKMPRYCLFGDTVNVANKMEAHGVPMKIHVSDATRISALKTNPSFEFTARGNVEIKGKGLMYTYFLVKNDRKSVWELTGKARPVDSSIDGYSELHDGFEEFHESINGLHTQKSIDEEENQHKSRKNKSTLCNII